MPTALDQLNGYRTQLAGLSPAEASANAPAVALGNLNALIDLLNKVKAVPGPEGDPGWIRAYGVSMTTMAGEWNNVHTTLNTAASQVQASWQGEPANAAHGLITSMGNDIGDVVTAFNATAHALGTWADDLQDAQHLDKVTVDRIDPLIGDINHIKDDAWNDRRNWKGADTPDDPGAFEAAAERRYPQLIPIWEDAEQIVSQRITAATNNLNTANQIIGVLAQLATNGVPAGPNAAPHGADALRTLLTNAQAAPVAPGTYDGDAATVASLMQLADSGQTLTPQQQAQLTTLLQTEGSNPEFATALLNDVGPNVFLQFLATPDGVQDADLAAVALATATSGASGQPNVTPAWVDQLNALGGEKFDGIYGYQVIGALLDDQGATFSSAFLQKIGTGMLTFETQHGGPSVWDTRYPVDNTSVPHMEDGLPESTFDPVYDLMEALSRNPDAAANFLADEPPAIPGIPTQPYALANYLLDRNWQADATLGWQDGSPVPGLVVLGNAFDAATRNGADPAQFGLAGQLYSELSSTESDKLSQGLGAGITNMTVNYINQGYINDAIESDPYHYLAAGPAVLSVIGILSQDPGQYQKIVSSEFGYLQGVLAAAPGYVWGTPTFRAVDSSGSLLAQMANGQFDGLITTAQTNDVRHNNPAWLTIFNQVTGASNNAIGNGVTLTSDLLDHARASGLVGAGMGTLASDMTNAILNRLHPPQNTVPTAQGDAMALFNTEAHAATSFVTTIPNGTLSMNDRQQIAADIGRYFNQAATTGKVQPPGFGTP